MGQKARYFSLASTSAAKAASRADFRHFAKQISPLAVQILLQACQLLIHQAQPPPYPGQRYPDECLNAAAPIRYVRCLTVLLQYPLGLPTVKDRIVPTALQRVVEPIFENELLAMNYGFRPRLGAQEE